MALLSNRSFNDYYTIHCLADDISNIQLIERFHLFLYEYVDLFSNQNINPYNYSIRSFLKYFSKGPDNSTYSSLRKRFNNNNKQKIKVSKMQSVINMKKVLSTMDLSDFIQELVSTLYTMCARYTSKRPSFHTYVLKSFHYTLIENLKDRYINYNTDIDLNQCEYMECEFTRSMFEYIDIDASYKLNLDMASVSRPIMPYTSCYSESFFDYNWIAGNYNNSIFNFLKPSEREILKLNLIDNMSQDDISIKYGCCRNTIINKSKKIRNKLEENFNRKSIYGQYRYNKKRD